VRFISPLLKHAVFPGLAKLGYLGRRDGGSPAILTYHGIMPAGYKMMDPDLDGSLVTAESFRRQIRLLMKRYNVVYPEQFLGWIESRQELPPRAVLLTCDDDLRNTLTEMVPVLQECGLSCLFFVTGASLGEVSSMLWYEQLYLMFLATRKRLTIRAIPVIVKKQAGSTVRVMHDGMDMIKGILVIYFNKLAGRYSFK